MNAFLDYGVGPQPLDAQRPSQPQMPGWMVDDWAQRTARDQQIQMQVAQMGAQQKAANDAGLMELGGRAAGSIYKAATKPAGPAQTYTMGGATTLSTASAPAYAAAAQKIPTGALLAPEVTSQAAGGTAGVAAGPTVLGTLGAGLGAAGTVYGSYSGITSGMQNVAALNNAARSGALTPEQEALAFQQARREGAKSAAVGGISGAIGGASSGATIGSLAGPVGTVVGGVTGAVLGGLGGSAGGNLQFMRSKKKRHD